MLKVVLRNLLDVTTLMTPGGIPASSARDAKARAGKGVWRCLINTVYQEKEKIQKYQALRYLTMECPQLV